MATEAEVSGEWCVYKTDDWLWPYVVAGPDGEFETRTQTEWGARRAIRRRKAREWWECPVVYREER
jgi:hypothetical protein